LKEKAFGGEIKEGGLGGACGTMEEKKNECGV
jgi:hypothetical protein